MVAYTISNLGIGPRTYLAEKSCWARELDEFNAKSGRSSVELSYLGTYSR